jgi:DNA-binding response OmpR family regulator
VQKAEKKTKWLNQMIRAENIRNEKSDSSQEEKTILIVDDEPAICRVLKEFLELKGFETHAVSVAEEALGILNETEVDLVITNINMPGMNGLELTRFIRDNYFSTVIILTGHREVCTREDAQRAGASDLLYKPARLEDLLTSIKVHLR